MTLFGSKPERDVNFSSSRTAFPTCVNNNNRDVNTMTSRDDVSRSSCGRTPDPAENSIRIYNQLTASRDRLYSGHFRPKNVNLMSTIDEKEEYAKSPLGDLECELNIDQRRASNGDSLNIDRFRSRDDNADATTPTTTSKRRRCNRRRLLKFVCWFGWIVCCPCWTLVFCLRDSPYDDDDAADDDVNDVCWPCTYDTDQERH